MHTFRISLSPLAQKTPFTDFVIKSVKGLDKIKNHKETAQSVIDEMIEKISLSAIYDIIDIDYCNKTETDLGCCKLFGEKISSFLEGSPSAIPFIITLGKEIDSYMDSLSAEDKFIEAMIAGTAATSALYIGKSYLEEDIRQNLKKEISCSISPGYDGWDISEQKKIFSMLDSKTIGVELSGSYMMTPLKSLSGIYSLSSRSEEESCSLCGMHGCLFRELKKNINLFRF